MKILSLLFVVLLIGISPVFAEEMYPVIEHYDVQVDIDDFRTTNNIIVNLNIDGIEFVPANQWNNTEFHVDVVYNDLTERISHQVDMSKVIFEPIGNIQISTNHERYGNEALSFEIDNIKEIITQGTENITLQFKLSSSEIQFDTALNDYYRLDILDYGWSDRDDFNLNDSKQEETSEDLTPAQTETSSLIEESQQNTELSYEEQQRIQAEETAKKHAELVAQRELEEIKELERQRELEKQIELKEKQTESKTTKEITDEIQMDPEPQMIPELIAEQIEEKRCGAGTILVDGYCKVLVAKALDPEPVKEKGFFEWLMSLFGM